MNGIQPLKGDKNFRRVLRGRQILGELLRCSYLVESSEAPFVGIGIRVPGRHYKAVERNRIKRLVRGACREEGASFLRAGRRILIILTFHGKPVLPIHRVTLQDIRRDVASLFHAIRGTVNA